MWLNPFFLISLQTTLCEIKTSACGQRLDADSVILLADHRFLLITFKLDYCWGLKAPEQQKVVVVAGKQEIDGGISKESDKI